MKNEILAVDPGFGDIKLQVNQRVIKITSAIARARSVGMAGIGMKSASQASTIQYGRETYVIGDGAWHHGDLLTNRDYSALSSPERKALVFGALTQALNAKEYVFDTMVIGLPVPLLMDEVQGQAIMGGLKSYKGTHEFSTEKGNYTITINRLKALAQPVGAYADWLLDEELRVRKNGRNAEAAVLDIGMNTLDLYVIQDGKVLPRFIGGDKVGVRRLLQLLSANGHEPEELDAMIRTGKLRPSRDQLESWLSEILASIERTWPNLRRFTTVIPAGGGSILLGDLLRMALISKGAAVAWPEDPSTANVRGLWKWGAYAR
ncbi:MAG TPA: ParM/StbA family protein [Anaerolineales bacterium]|nr:ParM/StbA family protein [Anaerolineales bacterium]